MNDGEKAAFYTGVVTGVGCTIFGLMLIVLLNNF